MAERQLGFQLGRYRCVEQLGDGALGETWRARLVGIAGFEKELVVKRLRRTLSEHAELMRRFLRAASLQTALASARIVCVHELEVVEGEYVLAAELVDGLDLARLRVLLRERGERVSDELALLVALEVVEALRYAHRRTDLAPGGVLHQCLQPARVMVLPSGDVRLLDVGLEAPLVRLGLVDPEPLARLAPFLAPEVRLARHVDARADVYGVGTLLADLAGGSTDARVAGILRSTLREDPDDRCANVQTLRDAILPLLGGRVARVRGELAGLVQRLMTEPGDRTVPDARPLFPPPELLLIESRAERPKEEATERGWGRAAPPAVAVGISSESVRAIAAQRDEDDDDEISIEIDVGRAPIGVGASNGVGARARAWLTDAGGRLTDAGGWLAGVGGRLASAGAAVAGAGTALVGWARARASLRVPVSARWPRPRELAALAGVLLIAGGLGAVGYAVVTARAREERARAIERPLHVNHAPHPAGVTPARRAAARTGSAVVAPAAPAPAQLRIRTEPAGAQVWIDGEPRGATPVELEMPEGLHAVTLAAAGRKLWHQPLSVSAGARQLEVGLVEAAPPRAASAGLKVRCATRGELRIFIDGADSGVDCPNAERIPLAPGRHHLALYAPRADALIDVQREVKVTTGGHSTRLYLKY